MSGILLGKTMGRSRELADRFAVESERLADLEVRARMAGRWLMASIQMSFAIMPAAIYWFAGHNISKGDDIDLDRHRRRLHDAADAAAVPDPVAARRSASKSRPRWRCSTASSSTSTCRSTSSSGPARASSSGVRGDVALRGRLVPLRRGRRRGRCRTIDADDPGRDAHGARRRDRLGQDDARLPRRAAVRAAAGLGDDRRRRHPRRHARARSRRPSASSRRRPTCSTPRSARTSASPSPDATDERGRRGGAGGPDPRPDRLAAGGLRHAGRRARLPLLRRREAAHRDRPHDPAQPAGAGPRRGDLGARHRDRARPSRQALDELSRGPHDDRDRAPPLDDPRRRPDRRARRRADRRARHARRAARSSAGATRRCSAAPRSARTARAPPSPERR